MQTVVEFIKTIRIHQWTKNLLIFAALIFSKNLGNAVLVLNSFYAFLAFCFLSSSVYVINDLLDAEHDRAHPVKRNRPIASGRLKALPALSGAFGLFLLALLLSALVKGGPVFTGLLGTYFALNLAYSTVVKKVVVADIMFIAFGFLLRVAAGGLAINVELSHWLIMCTFFAATMLASCKRRAELSTMDGKTVTRAVLADYTLSLLDIYIAISATATVLAYALYTVSERTLKAFNTTALIYTVPVVMYGISRYLFLVYRRKYGEDPAAVLIRDPGMILAVLIWLGLSFGILYQAAL
ncbi:MAG: decaprenyl-phosphate phosphoribosyltransferase [Planctomycetes bacterium]|nr:decaprenyl-phosphate phosphoribosyltransferase [Planctomycetota bacterium]